MVGNERTSRWESSFKSPCTWLGLVWLGQEQSVESVVSYQKSVKCRRNRKVVKNEYGETCRVFTLGDSVSDWEEWRVIPTERSKLSTVVKIVVRHWKYVHQLRFREESERGYCDQGSPKRERSQDRQVILCRIHHYEKTQLELRA